MPLLLCVCMRTCACALTPSCVCVHVCTLTPSVCVCVCVCVCVLVGGRGRQAGRLSPLNAEMMEAGVLWGGCEGWLRRSAHPLGGAVCRDYE